ncbi:YkvA family protein [Nocardioides rubriscoriae]|uniref:YkvA family protein n=1 Tax=Nocardioides rubriscoriae TaxID=642762 RepID=UPI001B877714|nr:YkvA family protein [Nocardioides rubriscoriae]
MDVSDLLTLVLVVLGVLFLLGVAVIVYVMWRYRVPPRGLAAMVGALVYLASPVDVLPEVVLGPLGLVDDAGVVTVVGIWVYTLVQARRILRDAGVRPARAPRSAPPAS